MLTYQDFRKWREATDSLEEVIDTHTGFIRLTREWLDHYEHIKAVDEPEVMPNPRFIWNAGSNSSAYAVHIIDQDHVNDYNVFGLCGEFFDNPKDVRVDEVDHSEGWLSLMGYEMPDDRYLCARCKKKQPNAGQGTFK